MVDIGTRDCIIITIRFALVITYVLTNEHFICNIMDDSIHEERKPDYVIANLFEGKPFDPDHDIVCTRPR